MDKKKLTRQELYDLVWQEPMLSLAKTYNISDVGLRKICIRMSIPMPQAGHWQKLKFGKAEPKVPLMKKYDGKNEIELAYRTEKDKGVSILSKLNSIKRDVENTVEDELVVPERLTNPDKLIIAARESLNNTKYLYNGMASTGRGELDIRVTKQNISRALRFMDTVIKLLRQRGHEIIVKNGETYAVVKTQEIQMSFRGKTKMVKKNDQSGITEFQPTGGLCFKVCGYTGKEWQDGKEPIENYLSAIVAKIETNSDSLNEIRDYWEKKRIKREEQERIQRELEEKKKIELSNFKEMLSKASRWHKAENLRNYIKAVEEKASGNNNLSPAVEQWLVWAGKKADWYGPFVEMEDELMKGVDKETLTITTKVSTFR